MQTVFEYVVCKARHIGAKLKKVVTQEAPEPKVWLAAFRLDA